MAMRAEAQMAADGRVYNPFKVFLGQLYGGTHSDLIRHALGELGSPPADCGIYVVSMVSPFRTLGL